MSSSGVKQRVECLLSLQRLPHVPNRRIRIRAVESRGGDLSLNDPVLYLCTVDTGIAFEFMEKQVELVRDHGPEVVDVCIPVPIKRRGENDPGIVVEDHEPQVMNSTYAVSVLLALTCESSGQQFADALGAAWFELADKGEFVRLLSGLRSWPAHCLLGGNHFFLLYF